MKPTAAGLRTFSNSKGVTKATGFESNRKLVEERGRLLFETPIHRVKKGSAKDRYTIQNLPPQYAVVIRSRHY